MAATTIAAMTWTNDSGSFASPVGDGSVINNAWLQTLLSNINGMWSGASSVVGGVFSAEGFGVHSLSAGGTGYNGLKVRNTTAGTGNFANLQVQADNGSVYLSASTFSSTYTSTNPYKANGSSIENNGAGGLSIIASNAAGDLRLYAGGNAAETVLIQAGSPLMMRVKCGLALEDYYDQTITGSMALASSFAAAHATHFRCTGSATPRITNCRSGLYHGEIVIISNVGATAIVIEHNTAGMGNVEILCPNSVNITLDQNDNAILMHDSVSGAWRVIGGVW